ncbi:MAG: hypothetical protein Q9222_002139 [Ikaeria aurantiellina]
MSRQDSVLSTLANIVGILTFAYAVAFGLFLRYRSLKNSGRDIQRLRTSIQHLIGPILTSVGDFWPAVQVGSTERGQTLIETQTLAMQNVMSHMNDLRQLTAKFSKGTDDTLRLRNWARFILSEEDLADKFAAAKRSIEALELAIDRYEKYAASLYRNRLMETLQQQQRLIERQGELLETLSSRLTGSERSGELIEGIEILEELLTKTDPLASKRKSF